MQYLEQFYSTWATCTCVLQHPQKIMWRKDWAGSKFYFSVLFSQPENLFCWLTQVCIICVWFLSYLSCTSQLKPLTPPPPTLPRPGTNRGIWQGLWSNHTKSSSPWGKSWDQIPLPLGTYRQGIKKNSQQTKQNKKILFTLNWSRTKYTLIRQ